MVNVGILGAGFMGQTHGDVYNKLENAQLVGIAERDEEKGLEFAKKFNCKYFRDAAELIDRADVDVIDICLPTHLHEEFSVMAAEHGKHILLEKPFALSMDSAERILKAVNEAGVKFMVAQVVRFWPEYNKIKEFYDKGILGRIKVIYANRLAQHPNWSDWFKDVSKSGGGLLDLHTHDIDYIYYLLGRPVSVYARGRKSPNGAWNHVVTTLEFPDGSVACAEGSSEMTDGFPFTMTFRAVGDRGTADFQFSAGFNLEDRASATDRLVLYRQQAEPEVINAKEEGDAYANEIRYFIDCVENGRYPSVITPEQSKDVLKIMFGIKESLETGKVVQFEK